MQLFFTPVLQRLGALAAGAETTALVSLAAMALSLLLGFPLMLARISRRRAVRWAAAAYLDLFRNTPFVVQLFFFYFGLPEIGVHLDELPTGVLALSLATATSVAEILRAGVEGVEGGIVEAGRSFGLSGFQLFRTIVLPIALRMAIRPLTSVFVNMVLTTSVLSTITVNELMASAQNIASETFRPFETYLLVLVLYCVVTFSVSGVMNAASLLWIRRSSAAAMAR